ncbi:MAG TPA: sigma-54-dependent Fis family transcriptional regulator [Thiolapillus brandeum]|uniref:Sigma-54-dependent Fis family transcriptional regulator n=1 Tax=Thiolapillus brandeum TaxID=1076588 RepID=A0A831JYQ5_9GAMM|nr:sigma-54-dependent Fis family transcriptional regulator [Thiolapillus brandeum]
MISMKLCLIEDDAIMGASLVSHLEGLGHEPVWFRSAEEALDNREHLARADIIVSDIRLPGISGEELFLLRRREFPEIPFMLITAFGSIDQAVRLIKEGLDDYISKPFQMTEFVEKLQHLGKRRQETRLAKKLIGDLCERMCKGDLVAGISPQMQEIGLLVKKVAPLPTTVLITGETGTGKEVIANLIHYCGQESGRPFVSINCAALPPSLLESELFGYERGAFTGADKRKQGKLELANNGTLFLDEIGELPMEIQVKLLRVLQEREFERLGGTKSIALKTRLITATNRDLKKLIAQKEFREDFFYRINIVTIHIPPLRERREDILFFARHFTRFFTKEFALPEKRLSPFAEAALMAYDFPGNVRELRNLIERAVALSDRDMLCPDDIFSSQPGWGGSGASYATLKDVVAETERNLILRVLEETGHSIGKTAEQLKISRTTLWEKMKRYAIEAERTNSNG